VNIEVRLATPTDLDVLRELEREVPGSDLDRDLLPGAMVSGSASVAVSNGVVAGFAVLAPWFFGRSLVSRIAVRSEYRRSGIATALLEHLGHCVGGSGLFISTNRSNSVARQLYEKLGFKRSGIIDNLDEDDPELVYYLRLPRNDA
jgi:ribosomal protein S18 acetylase RimI-like enzyme